jgi:hypothetical protein
LSSPPESPTAVQLLAAGQDTELKSPGPAPSDGMGACAVHTVPFHRSAARSPTNTAVQAPADEQLTEEKVVALGVWFTAGSSRHASPFQPSASA